MYIPSRNVVLERESVQWNENNPSSVRERDGTCDEPTTEIRVNTENPENPEIRKNPEIRENPEEDQNHTESEDEGGHCSLHDLGNASGNSHDRLMGRLQAKQLASLCLQNKTLYEAYVLAEDVPLPKNLKEALSTGNPYRKEWQAALNKEKASFVKNRVFGKFVRIEELKRRGIKIIRCKNVFKVKCLSDGTIERFKIRTVACGCAQIEGLQFDQTYAPTCRGTTIRLILSIAAQNDLELTGLDIEVAFLSAKIDTEIYIYRPIKNPLSL